MSQLLNLYHSPLEKGTTLIEASAGTGKTYSITVWVLRLLLEKRVDSIRHILVVTFTQAATEELSNAIHERLQQAIKAFDPDEPPTPLTEYCRQFGDSGCEILFQAMRDFDDMEISTIHAFCKRALERFAFETGAPFSRHFTANDHTLVTTAANDFWRQHLVQGSPWIAAVFATQNNLPTMCRTALTQSGQSPHAQVHPLCLPLDHEVKQLQATADQLAQLYDRDKILELMHELRFKKSPMRLEEPTVRETLMDRVEAVLKGTSFAYLQQLLELTPEKLTAIVYVRDQKKTSFTDLVGHPFIRALNQLKDHVNQLVLSLRAEFIREVKPRCDHIKRELNVLSFDDLLSRMYEAVTQDTAQAFLQTAMRQTYQAVMIDEFQDTDQRQYEILSRLFSKEQLFVIGDPKQAIYKFRGADVFAYLKAKDSVSQLYTLDKNQRSCQPLVTAVNALFQARANPFLFSQIQFTPASCADRVLADQLRDPESRFPLTWIHQTLNESMSKGELRKQIAHLTAAECARLLSGTVTLNDKPLKPNHLAILTRNHKQAKAIQMALDQRQIPNVLSRSGSIFETKAMLDVQTLLQAIAHPEDRRALHAALVGPIWGYPTKMLLALRENETEWQDISEQFHNYRQSWLDRGILPMVMALMDRKSTAQRCLQRLHGFREWSQILHALEVVHDHAQSNKLSPDAVISWLDRIDRADAVSPEDQELRLETDQEFVQVTTIHKSKGLTYAIAFCPFLWDRSIHDISGSVLTHNGQWDPVVVMDPDEQQKQRHFAEELAEDLRLTYVALTRAQYRCYVTWAWSNSDRRYSSANSGLAYLLMQQSQTQGDEGELAAEAANAAREDHGQTIRHNLNQLIHRHSEVMGEASWDPSFIPGPHAADDEAPKSQVHIREFPETSNTRRAWQSASFTSLTRNIPAEPLLMPALDEVQDEADPEPDNAVEIAREGMTAFARGARAGTCLHHIIENVDFQATDLETWRAPVMQTLERFQLHEPHTHQAPLEPPQTVMEMLQALIRTPLPSLGFTFAQCDTQFKEWPFHLAMAKHRPRRWAQLFREYGGNSRMLAYADRLEALSARTLQGFMTGFIDLLTCRQGQWMVVDWKSNDLGPGTQDYHQDAMWQAMVHHHYVLQYHLYIAAVHRYLQWRLPDYDYHIHMGPAIYVFLRGLGVDPACGWYQHKPEKPLIQAIDRLLGTG